jgi:acyl-CoA thioester hydrolase
MNHNQVLETPFCTYEITADSNHIDSNQHINNIIYLQWMQDAAIEHVIKAGVLEATKPLNVTWFAKKHTIEYIAQGFEGDQIKVITWVQELTAISTLRKYHIYRKADNKLLCKGETRWVMINTEKSKPKKIPKEIADLILVSFEDYIPKIID